MYRTHLSLCLASCIVLLAGVALAEEPSPVLAPELRAEQELDRLKAIWEQQQAEIKTAEIQLDHFVYVPAGVVRAPEIDAFLAKLEEALTPDALKADLVQATDTLPDAKLPAVWRTMTLYVDGVQRRVLENWVYPNGKRYSFDGAFDGTHTTSFEPDVRPNVRQGDVLGNITRLTDLRAHPRVPGSGVFVLEDLKPGALIRLSQGPWSIQVLQASGLVREARSRSSRSLHYQPVEFEGGVTFPRVSVVVRLQEENLHFLEVFRIRSARFNQDLPANALFVVPTH